MGNILVVDSHPAAARGLSRLLREDGHEVVALTSAKDALQLLARDSFDVVITDREMPDVDGDHIVEIARQHQPDACIVVVSVRAAQQFTRLMTLGACIVADKPLDYWKLTSLLDACRDRRAGEGHRRALLASPLSTTSVG